MILPALPMLIFCFRTERQGVCVSFAQRWIRLAKIFLDYCRLNSSGLREMFQLQLFISDTILNTPDKLWTL